MKYQHLFEPIKIGNTLFKNRIFSAPLGSADVNLEGTFTEEAYQFYERKAQGGAACVTLGEAIVDSRYGKRHPYQLSLDTRLPKRTLNRVADSIRKHGAIPSIELQHSGFNATPGITTPNYWSGTDMVFGPSATEIDGVKILEMPEDLILETIDKFADAALFCKNEGFGMVMVHAGHGWLLNQFMAERINHRTDRWGGSMENRARFTVEVIDAIHRKCGRGFPVEVRISASEGGLAGGYGVEEGLAFAQQLVGHADIIHCSASFGKLLPEEYKGFGIMFPTMFKPDGLNVKYAAEIKKHITDTPIATVGALTDPAMMEEIIASGQADIVEMARGLICDPDLPNKAFDGNEKDIVKCMRCFNCYSSAMNQSGFYCALNPKTNREHAFDNLKPAVKKKVLIAGGGIAGMQAALTAAENGHEVILCEKTERLGGHIRCEEKVPFKKKLMEYIDQRERFIREAGIEVRLNTTVTPEYVKQEGADAVIVALGAEPVKPRIPGIDGANVLSADEAYMHPEKVGNTPVIIGGGLVGMELALFLKLLGKNPQVVELAPNFNPGPNILQGNVLEAEFKEKGIPTSYSVQTEKIDEGGVWAKTPEGEKYFNADTVIYAVGQKPHMEEAMAFYDCGARYYPIGDCCLPKNIADANFTAVSVATDIGRF